MKRKDAPADDAGTLDVLAELDQEVAKLEQRDKQLLALQLEIEATGEEPREPSVSATKLDQIKQSLMNGHAPPSTLLSGGERLWSVQIERRAIGAAIIDYQRKSTREAVKLTARALQNHEARMAPILAQTRACVERLQELNRQRLASCELATQEARTLPWNAVPYRHFDLLGLGIGTGETIESGEAYELVELCKRDRKSVV
jgi:hypothetical protein